MLNRLREILFPAGEAPVREDRTMLATCVVLLEAAHADDEFTQEEQLQIVEVIRKRFGLTRETSHEILDEALQVREKTHDLWRFTNEINRNFTNEEKIAVMEEVWRLIYSDGVLHAYEDHLAHKLQHLLNLNHPQIISAKMKVLEELRRT
ncbi:MAG: TerB family tellurite resistance protein [Candidatus Hydrogenedentes bacterium]|nr:TerB family tellurite resistance protein [Candidatus Hydrogenedentota bacterium]